MGLLDGILGNVLGGVLGDAAGGLNRGSDSPFGGATGGLNSQSDNPLGGVLDRLGGGSGIAKMAFLALAFQLLQRNGGISGVIDKLRNAGLGAHADSWVGTGQNLPVSPDALQNALGPDVIGQLANRFGLSQDQASSGLAQVLPELVNQMTPHGAVPEGEHDLISDALSQLAPRT